MRAVRIEQFAGHTLLYVSNPFSRRELLAGSVALGASLKAAVTPTAKFPSDVSHRLSVSTYPFRSVIAKPASGTFTTPSSQTKGSEASAGMTLQQFAASIVQQFGVYGIEPWSRHFESIKPDYLNNLKSLFDAAGVRVVNIPCDVAVKPCGTAEESAKALDTWSQWVDAAILIGSPSIRVHVPPSPDGSEISCAVQALGAIAQYGESKGIVIDLENDDPRGEDPYRVVKVIEAVNSPFLRALPDFCNSMQIRNDQAENAKALAALFPHAFNISHVKDIEIVKGVELRVDVDRIFAIAKKAGYKGFFSMETEGTLDPYVGTKKLIAAARKNLA